MRRSRRLTAIAVVLFSLVPAALVLGGGWKWGGPP
jgi:hypothetical protein